MCTVIMFSPACFRMSRPQRAQEEWMLICQRTANLQPDSSSQDDDSSLPQPASQGTQHHAHSQHQQVRTIFKNIGVHNHQRPLREQQPYTTLHDGTAGTGKSYLIHCIRLLLGDTLKVSAPTGVASFIIEGTTLHYTFQQEESYREHLQQAMSTTRYMIIDEMSMLGCLDVWTD